jgi:LPXTG-site transpeptidase (sortase) family protein
MSKLRVFNDVLTVGVVLCALYLIIIPFVPGLKYRLITSRRPAVVYAGALGESAGSDRSNPRPIPSDNRIVIPSAYIDQSIVEGSDLGVIEMGGSWRKNFWTASPKDTGNTVIVGHRFTYTQPEGAFYHLDKVRVGDKLAVYWQGEELLYGVTDIREVAPDALYVEQNTPDRTLTLYTCTPLVTAERRLVVVAKPVEAQK